MYKIVYIVYMFHQLVTTFYSTQTASVLFTEHLHKYIISIMVCMLSFAGVMFLLE